MAKRFLVGDIKIEGMDEVIAELRRRGADAVAGIEKICHAGATMVREEIETRAPGSMAGEMVQETTSREGAHRIAVSVGVVKKQNYIARFLEFGVKPHVIPREKRRRRRVRVLKFNGRYTRRVNHPGFSARPFLRPGYEQSKGKAQSAMGATTKKLIRA